MRTPSLLTLLALVGTGCPDRTQDAATLEKRTVVLGVDAAIAPSGVHEFLRTAFEQKSDKRMELVIAPSYDLTKQAERGGLDGLLLATDVAFEMLDATGAVEQARVVAHEEMVIIGPAEDQIRSHGAKSAPEFIQNIGRFSALYFKAQRGSAEELVHREIMKAAKDREPGSFIEEKLHGLPYLERVVNHPRAYGMVLRSTLVLGASLGKKPNRVYLDGAPDLVVRLRAIAVRSSLTKRAPQPELVEFLMSPEISKAFGEVGRAKFGLPLYAAGDTEPGMGATVPGLVAERLPPVPTSSRTAVP